MPLARLSRRGSGATVAIGGMDRLITIETRLGTNAYGQPGGPWTDFAANLWAKWEHIGGKEVVNQTEYAAEVTDKFTHPYVPGVTPKMRVTPGTYGCVNLSVTSAAYSVWLTTSLPPMCSHLAQRLAAKSVQGPPGWP